MLVPCDHGTCTSAMVMSEGLGAYFEFKNNFLHLFNCNNLCHYYFYDVDDIKKNKVASKYYKYDGNGCPIESLD